MRHGPGGGTFHIQHATAAPLTAPSRHPRKPRSQTPLSPPAPPGTSSGFYTPPRTSERRDESTARAGGRRGRGRRAARARVAGGAGEGGGRASTEISEDEEAAEVPLGKLPPPTD